ncbi:3-hydroxyacyl-ACP dehydratase FabZ [Kibdelosporangium lantanae]
MTGLEHVLPHRGPMLLVDRVVHVARDEHLVAEKAVGEADPWCVEGVFPQVLVLESWCQSAAALAVWDRPVPDAATSVLLFGSVAEARFGPPVRAGAVLRHHVRLAKRAAGTFVLTGQSYVDEEVVLAVGRVVIANRPSGEYRGEQS